jgi:carbonic anhydrase
MLLKEKCNESEEALQKLIEGNTRFYTGDVLKHTFKSLKRFANGQSPFAAILGCSDSRVPIEIIFDQMEFGKLFVIRNAGNVVGLTVFESLKISIEELGIPLIVVLGHEKCSAVNMAVEDEENEDKNVIISKIRPSVESARAEGLTGCKLIERAEDLNIQHSVDEIKNNKFFKKYVEEGELQVVGAKYDIETGVVKFFD